MQAGYESGAPADTSTFRGWLRELQAREELTDARTPIPQSERGVLQARVNAVLPSDYLEIIDQVDGMRVGSCKIYGIRCVRKVVLPGDNFYLLAEINGDALRAVAVKEDDMSGELYLLTYGSEEVRPLGLSFTRVIDDFCN